ncbi:hypothetical protein GOP47_0027214 [Adiantum capillus-veneris]|nr:hypothetical protein GOP47_0027214 [Adiantum capillus-veneris]
MDCKESILLLLMMRYGAWETLPPLSTSKPFVEGGAIEHYHVQYIESSPKLLDGPTCSGPGGSPKSPAKSAIHPSPTCTRLFSRLSINGHASAFPAPPLNSWLSLSPIPRSLCLPTNVDKEKAPIYSCHHSR